MVKKSPAQGNVNFGAVTEGLVIIKGISNKNNMSTTGNWKFIERQMPKLTQSKQYTSFRLL